MIYVLDTNVFSQLFGSFYRSRFPSLWRRFDDLVGEGRIASTREVRREIEDGPLIELKSWARDHLQLFPAPASAEAVFVREIFAVPRFWQNVEREKLLRGGRNADAFLVARAKVLSEAGPSAVATNERIKPNAVKIPNICERFGIRCISLEGLMEQEAWVF